MIAQWSFLPLLVVLLLALGVPVFLSRYVRWMPVVVGEILAGILIGRSALNLIHEDITMEFLAEIGLAILMFLSGLEIDFSVLVGNQSKRHAGFKMLAVSAFTFVGTLCAAGLISQEIARRGLTQDPWIVALILSTTSLGVVVPILKERGLTNRLFGQTVLLSALLADFFTMFLITVYVAVKSKGATLNVLLIGVLFVAALLAYRIGMAGRRRSSFVRKLAERAVPSDRVKLQGALALLIAFVLLAKFIGTEMILGAFLAGAVLSLLSRPEDKPARQHLEALGFGFFIPIFFITVGIRFDLPALVNNKGTLALTGILLVSSIAVKIIPSLAFKALFSWRETAAAGILLSARLSLIIAASGIGLQLGLIDESTNASFILIAAITSTIAPLISHSFLAKPKGTPDRRMLIVGAGDMGLQVARELARNGEAVSFMESDDGGARRAEKEGFEVLRPGDRAGRWGMPRLESGSSLIALTGDDDRNMEFCRKAIDSGIHHAIAFVNDPMRIPEYKDLGVKTFAPGLFRAPLLAMMARNPDLFDLLLSDKAAHLVREIEIGNPSIDGKAVKDIPFGGGTLVLSIRRGKDFLIPHGHTSLELEDKVIVLGSQGALEDLAALLEKS